MLFYALCLALLAPTARGLEARPPFGHHAAFNSGDARTLLFPGNLIVHRDAFAIVPRNDLHVIVGADAHQGLHYFFHEDDVLRGVSWSPAARADAAIRERAFRQVRAWYWWANGCCLRAELGLGDQWLWDAACAPRAVPHRPNVTSGEGSD